MKQCSDPHHRHRSQDAADRCERGRLIYRQSNPADPLYVPVEQRVVQVPQQGGPTGKKAA